MFNEYDNMDLHASTRKGRRVLVSKCVDHNGGSGVEVCRPQRGDVSGHARRNSCGHRRLQGFCIVLARFQPEATNLWKTKHGFAAYDFEYSLVENAGILEYANVYVNVYIFVYTYIHIYIYIYMFLSVCIYEYIYIYVSVDSLLIHIYIYIYIYVSW